MKQILKTTIIFIFLFILELIYNLSTVNNFFTIDIVYKILFTFHFALCISVLTSLFSPKANKILFIFIIVLLTIYFYGQFIFFKLFGIPLAFSSFSLAGQAIDFRNIAFKVLKDNLIITIIYLLPLISVILVNKEITFKRLNLKELGFYFLTYFMSIIICISSLNIKKSKTYSAYNLYFNISAPSQTIKKFGLLTATNLDINRLIFDFESKVIDTKPAMKELKETEYNTVDIDFTKLLTEETDEEIKTLHNYFNNEVGTEKNAKTGIYKGKNLIFILAEGFNSIAVDKKLTPTLYKMVNSSFVFENFYSPMFLSTTGGEFQATTGLVPSQNTLSLWKSKTPKLIYSYGHAFKNVGYNVNSFHNWTYTYYKRDKTMPTQGFDNFLGCKNGLEKLMNCKIWPTSDVEMIDVTTDNYLDKSPFMAFYITVSGHAEYNFTGNNMARKNQDAVDALPYSDSVKAYLASQIELDHALKLLLKRLEEKGILDDTVIALVGDHYPYTLSIDEINEISSYKRDELFEINHSNFILYNSKTKKEKVSKIASNLDVLPTLLNMFGIEYDSRLLMGKDIFGTDEALVILPDGSWITDKGRFNAQENKFSKTTKENINADYVENINSQVTNKTTISNLIIKHNYYTIIEESRS